MTDAADRSITQRYDHHSPFTRHRCSSHSHCLVICQGNRITPSYVAFNENGERLIGDAAKNQATLNPLNTIYDVSTHEQRITHLYMVPIPIPLVPCDGEWRLLMMIFC